MDKILLIPAAKYKDEYEIYIPEIFKIHNTGVLNILYNIIGLPLDDFVKIYITINKKVDNKYGIKKMLEFQLDELNIGNKTEVIVIDDTVNVVDTILKSLSNINLLNNCGLFIKDADSNFVLNELNDENTVYTYFLEDVNQINPSEKSYVETTSDDIVLNIIEKRVISSEFCAGGYYFSNIINFIDLCENIHNYKRLYISNVIFYDILHNNEMYRTEQVISYNEN